jgi:hypothetical protein
MPLGRNSAQWPMHSDVRPSPWPRHSGAHDPLAGPAHGLHGPPAGMAREHAPERSPLSGRASRRGRHRLYHGGGGARLGARASTTEGSPTGQVGGGGNSPELLVDGKGGKTGRRRRSPTRWVLRWPTVSSVRVGMRRKRRRRYTWRKRWQGVLGAPLTVEGVVTVEAAEALAMGQLLAASSCTDGERVVRGGIRLQSKTRWCGDAGEAAARRPYRRRSGVRPGGEERSNSGDGGIQTCAVRRRSDSEAATRLRQRRGIVGRRLYGTVRACAAQVRARGSHAERAC